jgi:hypothetical protein
MNIAMDMNFFDTLLLIIYTNIVHAHACFENKLRQGLYSTRGRFYIIIGFLYIIMGGSGNKYRC